LRQPLVLGEDHSGAELDEADTARMSASIGNNSWSFKLAPMAGDRIEPPTRGFSVA